MQGTEPPATKPSQRRWLAVAVCLLAITSSPLAANDSRGATGVPLTPSSTPMPQPATAHLKVVPSSTRTDSLVFAWQGRIEAGMADAIARAFDQQKTGIRRVLLTIESGGGSVAEGRRVIAVLERIKQTHQLDTYVKAGSTCGSMCVPIYLQGQKRYAAPSSLWLFHEVSIRNQTTKQITKLDRDAFQKLVDDYFIPAGVSRDWIGDMMPKTEGADYWRTGDALLRENSNIIHHAATDTSKRSVTETAAGSSGGLSAR